MALTLSSLNSREALVNAIAPLGEIAKAKISEARQEAVAGDKEQRKAGLAFSALDTILNLAKLTAGSKLDLPAGITSRGITWLIDVILHYVTAALQRATPQQMAEVALIMKQLAGTLANVAEREIIVADTLLPELPTDEAEGS